MAVEKIGEDGFPEKTNVFISGEDQFCTMMTLKSQFLGPACDVVYDAAPKLTQADFPVDEGRGFGRLRHAHAVGGKIQYNSLDGS